MKYGKTHGKSNTRLYGVWSGMKDRCYNKNCKGYHHYGGRGIVVCDEWKDDFMSFYSWAMAAGYDETAPRGRYTIERKDNDGPYSPENCRWATIQEQERNKRNNIHVKVDGKAKILKQFCEEKGLRYSNELKTHQRRTQGIRPMSEYNQDREKKVQERAATLAAIMEAHPDWTNAQLANAMGTTVRTIQRLKARRDHGKKKARERSS